MRPRAVEGYVLKRATGSGIIVRNTDKGTEEMKRILVFCIALLLLAGCGGKEATPPQVQLDARAEATAAPVATAAPTAEPIATAVPAPTEAPASAAPAESRLADALTARWEQAGLLKTLYAMDSEDVLDLYGIDFSACRSGAAFRDAAGGYAVEAVFVEAEGAVLDEAEALLREHLSAVKEQFRSYDAEALALAEKAVLVREGDAVLFVISPDADGMLAAFRDLTR